MGTGGRGERARITGPSTIARSSSLAALALVRGLTLRVSAAAAVAVGAAVLCCSGCWNSRLLLRPHGVDNGPCSNNHALCRWTHHLLQHTSSAAEVHSVQYAYVAATAANGVLQFLPLHVLCVCSWLRVPPALLPLARMPHNSN